ncbi:MAG: DMT family transporter [Bacillota bacterium]
MKNGLGYLYIALAAFFFAVIAIVGKTVINMGIEVFDLLILQNVFSIVLLLVYFIFTGLKSLKIDGQEFKNILLQGIIGSAGTTVFYYLALERMNAGIASMLLFTNPVFVSLYFILSKTKRINTVNNSALIFAMLGSLMVINIFNIDLSKTPMTGLMFGVLASMAYAFFNVFADLKLKGIKPLVITFYTSSIILAVSVALNPSFFRFDFVITPKLLFYVFELSLISGILPIVFLYKGIELIGSERASIVATAELPITLLLAFFILKETMVLVQIAGTFLIIVSIIILHNEDRILEMLSGRRNKHV